MTLAIDECSMFYVGVPLNLLCSLLGRLPKVDDILAGVCEELLPKALKVAVDQCQHPCAQRTAIISQPSVNLG